MLAGVRIEPRGGIVLATLSGDVDMSNASHVAAALTAALTNEATRLVLDLSDVDYFDSTGIHLVLRLRQQLRTRGQSLRLVVPAGSRVRDVLDLAGVGEAITLDASLGAAMDASEGD